MNVTTVVFDLDGVLRHFDPTISSRIEDAHGLLRGQIEAAAFDPALLGPVTVGTITNREWVRAIGEAVGSAAAASEWRAQPFYVDDHMIQVARDLRDAGVHVSVFSNATDALGAELHGTVVLDVVECVFNSAELGCAKPVLDAYTTVAEKLGVGPPTILFVDDRLANVVAAKAVGMHGHHHQGRGRAAADVLRRALRDAGVELRRS